MSRALLLFPHQLFESNAQLAKGKRVYLSEDPLFFDQYPFHRQKLILHRATMQMHADYLRERGHAVTYLESGDVPTTDASIAAIAAAGVREIHIIDPTDDWLQQRIERASLRAQVGCVVHETPMFLSPPAFVDATLGGRKRLAMAPFYAKQRTRMQILMNGTVPLGGRWSLDALNRKRLPATLTPPPLPSLPSNRYIEEARRYVEARYAGNYGRIDGFRYPVTYSDARDWLRNFLEYRLSGFGDYEDAISSRERTLFHSVLTPLLNVGLLTPGEVVDAALAFAQDNPVPLNAIEGFIRQIIGWREFMRAAYVLKGRKQRTSNFWGHKRRLPDSFWHGTTGVAPLDTVIGRVLDDAYAHHIERLMVLANFMLLCELDADEVYHWFMVLFIDAYDWVMVPNVYGMALYADGGLITSKPYIAAANYIIKMSDFKRGPWSETWDGLFWRFVTKHEDFFASNPRLRVLTTRLRAMSRERLRNHLDAAERFLADL